MLVHLVGGSQLAAAAAPTLGEQDASSRQASKLQVNGRRQLAGGGPFTHPARFNLDIIVHHKDRSTTLRQKPGQERQKKACSVAMVSLICR